MITILVCFALIINIFPLETTGILSRQYRAQFGNFLMIGSKKTGILTIADVLDYHKEDNYSWREGEYLENINNVANPGLLKNDTFHSSVKAVVTELNKIKEDKLTDVSNQDTVMRAISAKIRGFKLSGCPVPNAVTYLNQRAADVVLKDGNLKQLFTQLDRVPEDSGDVNGMNIIAAMFRAIMFHMNDSGKQQITLHDFLLFMSEEPSEANPISALIQTAFKEYMLGLIRRDSTEYVTAGELNSFLKTHCGMEGEISGNFEHFMELMETNDPYSVTVTAVRKKWSTMSVRSAFKTLVKPSL